MSVGNEMLDFARLIEALSPWLPNLVIIGGWAHRLYRFHPLAQHLDYPPLSTLDTDVAVPIRLPDGEPNIATRLREHGFAESFLGDHQPPITQYRLGSEEGGFYAEFLTPLKGSGYKRNGASDTTTRVAGVSSQKLRYLDVLLEQPWSVQLDRSTGYPSDTKTKIWIPNAVTFIIQKLLIHNKREPKHRAKDVLYIHDTIENFGNSLSTLNALWRGELKIRLGDSVAVKVESAITEMFSRTTDAIRDSAEISRSAGRELRPDELREVCHAGMGMIFM